MMRLSFVSLAGLLSLAACSSSSGPTSEPSLPLDLDAEAPPPDAGEAEAEAAPPTVSTFCMKVAATVGTVAAKCLGGSAIDWQTDFEEQTTCADLDAAVAAKRIGFDEGETASCLSAIAALECDVVLGGNFFPAACDGAFVGKVKTGGACQGSLDCDPKDYCDKEDSTCGGTCKARVAAGGACDDSNACPTGYECGSTSTCQKVVPPTLVGQGDACGYDTTTKKTNACDVGLTCDTTSSRCIKPVVAGGSCDPTSSNCAPFLYCNENSKTCLAEPGVGEACGTIAGANVPCFGLLNCATPVGSTEGKCALLLAGGKKCVSSNDCLSGVCSAGGGATTCGDYCQTE